MYMIKNDFRAACEYAEKSIACRDSLEADNKTEYISNMNAFQEHERQQQRIARMNRELSEQELSYYRLAVLLLLFLGAFIVFRIKQAKKKVEVSLKEKELDMVQLQNSLRETEIKYLKEKHDREAIEIELLNQSVEYYKRLNALTVPILMKSRNSQLTLEEVRFACLLKMELSLSLLSEVYHIAKGSISRKKMRLKEKMQIENTTLDDFIKQF